MSLEEKLNNLSRGDELILKDDRGDEFEVVFLGSKKEERMDPHAERQQYYKWYMEDDSLRCMS